MWLGGGGVHACVSVWVGSCMCVCRCARGCIHVCVHELGVDCKRECDTSNRVNIIDSICYC